MPFCRKNSQNNQPEKISTFLVDLEAQEKREEGKTKDKIKNEGNHYMNAKWGLTQDYP